MSGKTPAGKTVRRPAAGSGKASAFPTAHLNAALIKAVAEEKAGQSHGAISAVMREAATAARATALQGADRGDEIAARLTRSVDLIVKSLFAHAPRSSRDFAVCAVGGYGRRQLAPYSDVDLLFLYDPSFETAIRAGLDFILYPLWDSGMKIGHNVHTPESATAFAAEDVIARTAYLDIRFLCGVRSVFDDFASRFDKLRRRSAVEFVAAKLEEQAHRQAEAGETRYIVEPDIKEGKGGLRDVQTIRWLYKYVYGDEKKGRENAAEIMGKAERRSLAKVEKFLWSVRAHLHDLRGRADERLTFDIQPALAERLGYADRPGMTAAERLMRHYFVNTVETGRLTRILCVRLEEESAKRLPRFPKSLPKLLQADEAPGAPNIRLRNGRLDFENPARASKTSMDLFRLFRAFSKQPRYDFHPDALAVVSEHTASITSSVRKDPDIANLFKQILLSKADPVRTLRVMTETGLLGKYIPAYGDIVGRIDYGLYRRFTLDEHVLRSLGVLRDIRSGVLKDEHPICFGIIKRSDSAIVIALALLLHESRWTVRGRSPAETERLVRRIVRRLGLNPQQTALAAWGAAYHLHMVRTAERRNLTEASAIAQFAREVGTLERLDLMTVLSVCHLRVVGAFSWDETTRRQLSSLYELSHAWLEGGDDALRRRLEDRANLARRQALSRLRNWRADEKRAFLARLSSDMLRALDTDIIVRFAHLARAADADDASAAVTVTPRDGDFECIIYADDRPGFLADIAGVIAEAGLSVRTVQALTAMDGRAFDIFSVQTADGAPVDDPEQARRLHKAILAAARSSPDETPRLMRRLGDRRPLFTVAPQVRLELAASDDATVIEAEGLDRPGLLYELARALGDMDVQIASAHVATYGERAVDAFYLQDEKGRKITDRRVLNRIEKRLLAILSSGSDE
ncbi:MAG: [protein-PII] uridylyltransferase [Pseudomonadota bacterium]